MTTPDNPGCRDKVACPRCGRFVRAITLHEPEVCRATRAAAATGPAGWTPDRAWPKAPLLARAG